MLGAYVRVLKAAGGAPAPAPGKGSDAPSPRKGGGVAYRKDSPVHERLRLAGVVREEGGVLLPRNLIYRTVFDEAWARRKMPADVPMIVGSVSGAAVVVVLLFLWLNWYTRAQEQRAVNAALDLGGLFEREKGEVRLVFRHRKRFGPELEQLSWLTGLTAIDFNGSRLNDEDLARLGHLDALRSFSVRFLKPIGLALPGLRGLTDLKALDLGGTLVTDEGLAGLRTFADLRTLNLSRLDVSDRGLASLGALTRLTTLDLSGTKVTGPGLERLAA